MDIEKEISNLIIRIGILEKDNEQKDQRINQLEERVKELEVENTDLKEQLHKKNSKNSSIPPPKMKTGLNPTNHLERVREERVEVSKVTKDAI